MKVCIVGGTGHISTPITKLLVQMGHEVVCFNRGKSEEKVPGARLLIGERGNRKAYEEAIQAEKFDAAIDMIGFSKEDAESDIRAFRGVKHFVFCSTVCVYGNVYEWLPASEDHPLRPCSDYGRNKVAAENAFMEAYHREGFPVTIIRPSTTYGPRMGLLRQIAWDFNWIDRIRKGKPLLMCGDGNAMHQFLYMADAAPGFAYALGRDRCIGQAYNLVRRGFTTWAEHHRTAMKVVGREVELVGVPLADLVALKVPAVGICEEIFGNNTIYTCDKIARDIPEFSPQVSLAEGMRLTIEASDKCGRIGNSDKDTWEDRIIEAQRKVRQVKLA